MGKRIKYPLKAYQVLIVWHAHEDDNMETGREVVVILDDELDADLMTDFYAYFNWLYHEEDGTADWEIIDAIELTIANKQDLSKLNFGKFREFYERYGTGEDLHV